MTEKEKILIAGCLKGEKAAWDAFVLQYSALVFHTIKKTFSVYHSQPRQDDAEDLYQEFFLSILRDDFKRLRQFRGDKGCSLASWLRVIAARSTIDFLRKQGVSMIGVTDDVAPNGPDATTSLIVKEHERLLSEALETLSPRDRLVVELHYRRGLPPEEIATMLRVSVNAVYTQKSRILDKLREILIKAGAL